MGIRSRIISDAGLRYFFETAKWHYYKGTVKRYSDLEYITRWYERVLGEKPNLHDPKLFTEKLQWLKLFYRDRRMVQCSNKVTVKEYVAGHGFADILVPTVAVYAKASEIDPSQLPERCIIKSSHGSGRNLAVMDRDAADWKKIVRLCGAWMQQDHYVYGREWNYTDQPRHIIVEPLLSDVPLVDYKVMCFNGAAKAIQVNHTVAGVRCVDFYGPDWNFLRDMDVGVSPHGSAAIPAPASLARMKETAGKLSAPFPFVRVDFYDLDGRLYFGEMTFFPGSGYLAISPRERNLEFGNWLELPEPNFNL